MTSTLTVAIDSFHQEHLQLQQLLLAQPQRVIKVQLGPQDYV
jgi:hypothetical protein